MNRYSQPLLYEIEREVEKTGDSFGLYEKFNKKYQECIKKIGTYKELKNIYEEIRNSDSSIDIKMEAYDKITEIYEMSN